MKLRVIKEFYDKENNNELRKQGQEFAAANKQAEFLISIGQQKQSQRVGKQRKAVIQNLPRRRRAKHLITYHQ